MEIIQCDWLTAELGVTCKVNISCCTCDAGGTKTTRLSCYILCSLGSDLFALHADVDECSGNVAVCSQTCTNTDGSFECGCEPGYVLDTNGFTCNGEAQGCLSTLGLEGYQDNSVFSRY